VFFAEQRQSWHSPACGRQALLAVLSLLPLPGNANLPIGVFSPLLLNLWIALHNESPFDRVPRLRDGIEGQWPPAFLGGRT
jgi:hypothetical protein